MSGSGERFDVAAHAFVADLDRPALDDADRHHLERVLRLRPGDRLTVSDGTGAWRFARFGRELQPDGPIERVERPRPAITIGVAVLKGDRTELVVQKLTEVGVDRIVPLVCDRSVVRWEGDRARRHLGRLRRIAREAAMQSRQVWLPEVADVTPFTAVAVLPGVAIATMRGGPPSLDHPTVLVGPEGGWSQREEAAGVPAVNLGPSVLRSETAAVVASALLSALRHGIVMTVR